MTLSLAEIEARFESLLQSLDREDLLLTPVTTLSMISTGVEAIFEDLDPGRGEFFPEELVDELRRPINRARAYDAVTSFVTRAEANRSSHPARAALHDLVDRAHVRVPGSPLLAFSMLVHPRDMSHGGKLVVPTLEEIFRGGFHPQCHFRRMLQPLESALGTSELTGERRAAALMRCAAEVAEALYLPYLRVVLALIRFADERWPAFPDRFGATTRLLHDLIGTKHPDLVDLRLVALRNAASHNGWNYHHETDELEYWDLEGPRVRAKVEDLCDQIFWPAYRLSAGFLLSVATVYSCRTILLDTHFFEFFDEFAPALQASNAAKQQRAIEAIDAWGDTAFEALHRFLAAKA